jgi:hypothetical protein
METTATRDLKAITLAEIEGAFSKALSELAGHEYTVTLGGLQFEHIEIQAMIGSERASFTGRMQKKRTYSLGFDDKPVA